MALRSGFTVPFDIESEPDSPKREGYPRQEASIRSVDEDDYLYKRKGFLVALRSYFTVTRLVFFCTILVLTIVVPWRLHHSADDIFKVEVGHSLSLMSREACQTACERTIYMPADARKYGGTGVCQKEENNKTKYLARFQLCERSWRESEECKDVQEWNATEMMRKYGDGTEELSQFTTQYTTRCTFKVAVPYWKVGFVVFVAASTIFLVVDGVAADMTFVIACCMLAAVGILTLGEAFGGMTSSSIVSLAFLFPLTKALERTGLLNKIIMPLLGSPTSQFIAVLKMFFMVMFISGIMSNAPLTVTMQPLVTKFSRRLGVHPGKVLMPLSYAVMSGASLTVIGTISGLVAKEMVKEVYRMEMFDTFFTCLSVGVVVGPACAFLSTTAILRSSKAADKVLNTIGADSPIKKGEYAISLLVMVDGDYDGADTARTIEDLSCVPGISSVLSEANVDYLAAEQRLIVRGTPEGLARARRIEGLELVNARDLASLGSSRNQRKLFEGAVAAIDECSPLADLDAKALRETMGCALLASRGPHGTQPWTPDEGGQVKEGDTLLFEANPKDVNKRTKSYDAAFILVKAVPNSEPPRSGHKWDFASAVFVLLIFIGLVALVSSGVIKLHWGAGLAMGVLILTNRLTWEQALSSVNVPVIFIVGAGMGVAKAIDKVGLSNFIAETALAIGEPYGLHGIAAAVYIVCAFLGLFLNQGAIVAMMAPVVLEMERSSQQLDFLGVKALVHVVCFASTSALCSPLGSPPNLLVMKPGEYALIDYARFGCLLQIIHGLCCIFLVPLIVVSFL